MAEFTVTLTAPQAAKLAATDLDKLDAAVVSALGLAAPPGFSLAGNVLTCLNNEGNNVTPAQLTTALANATFPPNAQLSDADRTTARNAVLTIINSAVGVRFQDTTQAQKLALVAALLFQAGALDKDLIVQPPAGWL